MFVHCAKIYQCEVGLLQGETLIILAPILVDEHPPLVGVFFQSPWLTLDTLHNKIYVTWVGCYSIYELTIN